MGCPHGNENRTRDDGIERRQFLLSAVAIGGTSAFSACLGREDGEPAAGNGSPVPANGSGGKQDTNTSANGTQDTDDDIALIDGRQRDANFDEVTYRHMSREESQHAWNRHLRTNEHGVPQPPQHHVVVMADYQGSDTPTATEREELEAALTELETAYEWSNEGLLFTVGYSPSYFNRFDESLPADIGLQPPVVISPSDSPTLESYDVCLHLASDYAQAVLGAEEALFGDVSELNGTSIEHTLEGILKKRDRRTGFVGEGLPAKNQDVEGIPDSHPVPEESPLYMGFETQHSLLEEHPDYGESEVPFVHNQNSEYGVAIKDGRFSGGTTQQVSHLKLSLGDWYNDLSLDTRVQRILSVSTPGTRRVGKTAENAREFDRFMGVHAMQDRIDELGYIGHAQKVARGRENNVSPLLRRDFDTTDEGHAGVHFVSLQESISDFIETRALMNGRDVVANFDDIEQEKNNGILEFIGVESRANFLIPPTRLRSLPRPQ